MSDVLLSRIAAVIHRELSPPCCDECHDWGPEPWEIALADAVIRELGLQREQLGEDSGYPHHQHRYVTEWFTNG